MKTKAQRAVRTIRLIIRYRRSIRKVMGALYVMSLGMHAVRSLNSHRKS